MRKIEKNKKNNKNNKNNKKKLVKECDRLFSLIVRQKMQYCFCCGTKERLTCGHLITRANYAVRWDFDNAVTQCYKCNYLHEFRPEILTNLYIKSFGADKYNELVEKSKRHIKINDIYLNELKDYLKSILDDLKEASNEF